MRRTMRKTMRKTMKKTMRKTMRKRTKKTMRKTMRKRTKKEKIKGGSGEREVMELLKRKSFGDEEVKDADIYALLNQVKNDDELYDAIFKINRQLTTPDQKDAFIQTAYFFQEDPYKVSNRFPRCRFLPNCRRANPIHQLSHTYTHPATLIAEAISELNK